MSGLIQSNAKATPNGAISALNRSHDSAVLHRSLHHAPLRVVGGSGHYLELSNGQKILDATTGAAVACLGHGNERVKKAMARQMDEISYCHSLFFSTSAAEELASELTASTHGHMSKAFIVSSGRDPRGEAVYSEQSHSMRRLRSHGSSVEIGTPVLPRDGAATAGPNQVHREERCLSWKHAWRAFDEQHLIPKNSVRTDAGGSWPSIRLQCLQRTA